MRIFGFDIQEVAVFLGLIYIVYAKYFKSSPPCPKCGSTLPKFRSPKNIKQVFIGGWTCTKCKSEIDSSFFKR